MEAFKRNDPRTCLNVHESLQRIRSFEKFVAKSPLSQMQLSSTLPPYNSRFCPQPNSRSLWLSDMSNSASKSQEKVWAKCDSEVEDINSAFEEKHSEPLYYNQIKSSYPEFQSLPPSRMGISQDNYLKPTVRWEQVEFNAYNAPSTIQTSFWPGPNEPRQPMGRWPHPDQRFREPWNVSSDNRLAHPPSSSYSWDFEKPPQRSPLVQGPSGYYGRPPSTNHWETRPNARDSQYLFQTSAHLSENSAHAFSTSRFFNY